MANAIPGETRSKSKPWQRMHDGTLYDGWEVPRPEVNGRSYLFHLPPIGIGTAAVESLTGYVSRLAAAHAVETGVLVNRELLPRIPYTKGARTGRVPTKLPRYSFYLDAHTLNGLTDRPRLWVSLLEELTCIERLHLLTALPWANTLSCVHLLRVNRAWCPYCYGSETSSAQTLYERLLWAFQIVTVCPNHRRPLHSSCPSCDRTQYVFSSKSRPGYCSRCQCWLGREHDANTVDGDLAEQIRVAEMVGELLAASPILSAGFGTDLFRENVRSYVHDAGGILRFRAAFQNRHVRGWIRRAEVPRIDSVVALSLNQNVSLVRVLTEPIRGRNTDHRPDSHIHHRVLHSVVEEALQTTLQAAIPPPLQEIANQLQYRTVASLKKRFPVLCDEIVSRRQAAPKTFRPQTGTMPAVPRERVETALLEELNKDGLTDLRTVAASVGLSSKRRFYKGFHDLRLAIVAKNAAIRQRRVDAIENALKAAFDEQPIPTVAEVARRLGFAGARPVASRFPQLAATLSSHRHDRARRSIASSPLLQMMSDPAVQL